MLNDDAIIPSFISFDTLDKLIRLNPYVRLKWASLDDETKISYHAYLNMLIQNHRWKGVPIGSPFQGAAFPRRVDCTLIYFYGQEVPINHPLYTTEMQIIPIQIIVEACAWLLQREQFQDLKILRDMGVSVTTVGPIFTEFQGRNYRGQEVVPARFSLMDNPLPDPIWTYLKYFSLDFQQKRSMQFNMIRG